MDKTISTSFLIVVSMVLVMVLFNAVYPAVQDSSSAMLNMTGRVDDRLRSQIEIIHAAAELDSTGWWQDTNGNGYFDSFVWIKNVGSTRVVSPEQLDVFYGPEGNFDRIPHESNASGRYPNWTWQVEDGGEWVPTATLAVTIRYDYPLAPGRYFIKVTLPNGVSDSYLIGF